MKKLPLRKYLRTGKYAFSNYFTGESIYPFYASFKVTHKCSLKCKFCNVWMEKTPDLPKEDVFKVLCPNCNKNKGKIISGKKIEVC